MTGLSLLSVMAVQSRGAGGARLSFQSFWGVARRLSVISFSSLHSRRSGTTRVSMWARGTPWTPLSWLSWQPWKSLKARRSWFTL